jgi:hypothetical protein
MCFCLVMELIRTCILYACAGIHRHIKEVEGLVLLKKKERNTQRKKTRQSEICSLLHLMI